MGNSILERVWLSKWYPTSPALYLSNGRQSIFDNYTGSGAFSHSEPDYLKQIEMEPEIREKVELAIKKFVEEKLFDATQKGGGIMENLYENSLINYYINNENKKILDKNSRKVVNYKYETLGKGENAVCKTTLKFADGREFSVTAPADKADPYYGFYACLAKAAYGGRANSLAEYWIEKKPKQEARELARKKKQEEMRNAEIRRKERKAQRERNEAEAKRRYEQYKIAQLAEKLYGVPVDFEG